VENYITEYIKAVEYQLQTCNLLHVYHYLDILSEKSKKKSEV